MLSPGNVKDFLGRTATRVSADIGDDPFAEGELD